MQADSLYLRTVKMNPRLDFFFRSETKEKKWDPFPLPVYKTLPKTVLGPCLQSGLESRSQGKSTFLKKNWGFTIKKHRFCGKNDQNSDLQKQENVHINHLQKTYRTIAKIISF